LLIVALSWTSPSQGRVAPLACVADELDGGRLVVLGAEPYLAVRYAIVKLKGQPLTAAVVRFREYVREAERVFTEQEQVLLERWRPRPAQPTQAGTATNAPSRSRRRPAPRK
jgi:hypothetical protein